MSYWPTIGTTPPPVALMLDAEKEAGEVSPFGCLLVSRGKFCKIRPSVKHPHFRIFKRYSQMKLQMKREALEKINRRANEMSLNQDMDSGTSMIQ